MRIGLDFGGTNLKMGVFDDNGKEIAFKSIPVSEIPTQNGLWEGVLDAAAEFGKPYKFSALGLSIKGLVASDGTMCDDIGLAAHFRGVKLKNSLESRFGVPSRVVNDARAYGWGEYKFGAGQGSQIMVCLTLGTGLGCSIVSDGKPWMSADPTGGILGGHISIDRNGPECPCGNRGCLEGFCSAPALRARILEDHPELASENDVVAIFFNKIREGAPVYKPLLDAWTSDLSLGIVSLVHTCGADRVVIGGGVAESADVFLPLVRSIVHQRAWTWPRGVTQIESALLDNRAAALGAAFFPEL
jgi:glucokinase